MMFDMWWRWCRKKMTMQWQKEKLSAAPGLNCGDIYSVNILNACGLEWSAEYFIVGQHVCVCVFPRLRACFLVPVSGIMGVEPLAEHSELSSQKRWACPTPPSFLLRPSVLPSANMLRRDPLRAFLHMDEPTAQL